MKTIISSAIFWIILFFQSTALVAQQVGSFTVGGNFSLFYPVVFADGGFSQNTETILNIGRSSVHENSLWRGSVSSQFIFHSTSWGHGSSHINATIYTGKDVTFIAGWADGTEGGGDGAIIWLRGGGTTYHYSSNYAVNPSVYDSPQGYNEMYNGIAVNRPPKSSVESYVNSYGDMIHGSLSLGSIGAPPSSQANNWPISNTTILLNAKDYPIIGFHDSEERTDFIRGGKGTIQLGHNGGWGEANIGFPGGGIWNSTGNVGIGTTIVPIGYKMVVEGKIGVRKMIVSQISSWPDYVFTPNYQLRSLKDIEDYINKNKHLPEVPSSEEVSRQGVDVGENQAILLKKIEELTLYMIELNKENKAMQLRITELEKISEVH